MRQMSLKISIIIFFIAVWGHASAHPPCGAGYHDRCGQYGCVNGLPAYVPGIGGGGQTQTTTQETNITIINK